MTRLMIWAAVLCSTAGPAWAQGTGPVAGDAVRGHELFMSSGCYQCHGTAGQGGVGLRLAPSPLPAQAIRTYLRDPSGEMPPYTSAVLSDAAIEDIHAYLAGIAPAPDVGSIAELKLGPRR